MKKFFIFTLVLSLAFILAACTQPANSSSAASSETSTSEFVGMANPWSEAASAKDAAAGAGVEDFILPEENTSFANGPFNIYQYQYMDGMAQADGYVGAAILCIRKGIYAGDGDISGDYTQYKKEWTLDVNGMEVRCAGNEEGRSSKTLWVSGNYAYCILATAQGDDPTAFGLSEEDTIALVNAIK